MQHSTHHTDHELLVAIAAGNETAYHHLFHRHWDALYSSALLLTKSPEIAEDIAQDIFTMLWEKRRDLAHVDNLEAFLFVSARNKIYSRLRKLASEDSYREYLRSYLRETRGEEPIFSRDLEQQLQRAVQQLPPQQQRAFRLSRFDGLDHEQIAQRMGLSKVTIKSYIVQALVTLRKALSHYTLPLMIGLFLNA